MELLNIQNLLLIAAKSIAVYAFILIAIRIFGKKELAQLSVVDLVFILLISNSVQNAMVGPDNSLFGGFAAATGLFLINYILKKLSYKFPWFSKSLQGESTMLIYDGRVIQKNMEKALISIGELEAAVREHGVETIKEVDLAVLEVDGSVSVLSDNFKHRTSKRKKAHKAINKQQ